MNDFSDLRREFDEALQNRCVDDSCTQEDEADKEEYPDYVEAMYNRVLAPSRSGIYFSRWDLKVIGNAIEASIPMDTRNRMFKLLMKSIDSRETMQTLLDAFGEHIDAKCEVYRNLAEQFPASSGVFEEKLRKAAKTQQYFDTILEEFF